MKKGKSSPLARIENRAVIVGGGIGGLSAAISLASSGWDVQVVEQAPAISEVGAGIQISPNGMRGLRALGVVEQLEGAFFEPDYIALKSGVSGHSVFRLAMKDIATQRWGDRFVQVHRADLQDALRVRLEEVVGDVIHTGAAVTGYVRERGGASVYVDGAERIFGNLVIGADGVHSVVRNQMHGTDRARFTGHVAWRCLVDAAALTDEIPTGTTVWFGDHQHALTTRIRGGDVINFVAIAEQEGWTEEGWSLPGKKEDALAMFEGWDPFLSEILTKTSNINRWALLSRPQLSTWQDGPVGLLGDAAHPMLPSMAQGAVQALEDAIVLGQCLPSGSKTEEGLARYEARRKPRTTRIQQRSAQNLGLFHRKGGWQKLALMGPLTIAGHLAPSLIHRQQDWIYGFDPLA